MESNWWTTFPWGWLIAVIALYLIGYYEGRATGYRRRKKEEQKEKESQPPPQPQIVTQTVTETVTVDDPGLLRIKNESEGFTLDLDGARVNPISLLPEQRKRLIEILNIMRPWLEGRAAPAPASPPAPPTMSSSQAGLLNRMQPAPAPSTPPARTPPTPPPPAAQRSATIAKEDRPAAPAGSMIGQIDDILQARLAGTPLEERGIFLSQSPEGGVIVFIGLTRYNGIDDVPDPEVKAVIRAAIAEWEDKFTPGLR
jgi:hypothetical protein